MTVRTGRTGVVVSTVELELDSLVIVDHQTFQVIEFVALPEGLQVVLSPAFGDNWKLEVHENDLNEPMWELA